METSGMISLGHIVVAVDGSENALRACSVAASLAKSYNSEMTVLHVVTAEGVFTGAEAEQYYTSSNKEAEKLIEKAASLAESEGLKVNRKILRARTSIVQTIAEYADSSKSDLIVVGTRGLGGFRRMLIGSVSSGLVANARCPVMVVRMTPSEETIQFKHVLVAIDGSESASRAATVAIDLSKKMVADLTILHVIHIPSSVYSSGGVGLIPMDRIVREAKQEAEKFVSAAASAAKERGVEAKGEIVQDTQSPVWEIIQYAEKNRSELIVLGTRGLGGFRRVLLGSVAGGVVSYAHCSVLVVR
jgi:nucleotide-binding universal stress UspA family protein